MKIEINSEKFEEIISSDLITIIDFWAPWCGPCRVLSKILDEISEDYKDRINIGTCNVEDNEELAEEVGIRNIPTLLFYKNGDLIDRLSGAQSKNNIKEKIDSLL